MQVCRTRSICAHGFKPLCGLRQQHNCLAAPAHGEQNPRLDQVHMRAVSVIKSFRVEA